MNSKARKKKIVCIVGQTATGKSGLAVRLAIKFNGEIISADSRQVYKYLNIGSGKVTYKEKRGVKHHCLDIIHPKNIFTALDYKKCADDAIKSICAKNKIPIIVGGTGFYIDALLNNIYIPEIPANTKLRKSLDKKSVGTLFKILRGIDPVRANNIDRKNKRRLIRAIEIVSLTGKPVPRARISNKYNALILGIRKDKKELRKLIHSRLISRINKGMIRETNNIHCRHKVSWKRLNDLGLEYRYVSYYLRGKMNRKEMLEELEKEIYKYARRQNTYFKKNKSIKWVTKYSEVENIVKKFI